MPKNYCNEVECASVNHVNRVQAVLKYVNLRAQEVSTNITNSR